MNRTPPAAVRRALRQEVGFGCPVVGCRDPLLTWHHFDPPWSEREHHEISGMIALCRSHHAAADEGTYSRGELRALKSTPRNGTPSGAALPWEKRELLVRLGGCYAGGSAVAVSVGGQPAIHFSRSPEGLVLVSLFLRDRTGLALVEIEENMLVANPDELEDLEVTCGATHLKAWLGHRDIGLEVALRRLSMVELDAQLAADRAAAKPPPGLPPEFLDLLSNRPESDMVGAFVKEWATSHCMDDEGRIPLLDVQRLALFRQGQRIQIGRGIEAVNLTVQYSASFDNGGAGFAL